MPAAIDPKYRTPIGEPIFSSLSGTYKPFGPQATPTASIVGFVNLNSNEQFFTAVELFSDQTIIATGSDAVIAIKNVVANVNSSNSSYAWLVHGLIQTRNLSDRFCNNLTGGFIDYLSYFRKANDLADIAADPKLGLGTVGVIAVKKIKYGENIRPLHFSIATSAGVSFSNTSSGDSTWGLITRDSDGASAGIIFYDIGIAMIHGPSLSAAQAISAVTAVTLQSTYKIWQLNAFCTAGADDLRYPFNPSAYYIYGVSGDPQWNPSLTSFTNYGYKWGVPLDGSASTTVSSQGTFFLSRLGETFGPYITTIGLYNISGDMLAVAKLSAPIKKPQTYPITFRIALDFD